MKRIQTLVQSNFFYSLSDIQDIFSIQMILKYCPDDISQRGVLHGQNFYVSLLNTEQTKYELSLSTLQIFIEKEISLFDHNKTLNLLISSIQNPFSHQTFSSSEFQTHIKQLQACIKH